MAFSAWKSPTSVFSEADANNFGEGYGKGIVTPRSGMSRSRREELELWREQKRQKLAETKSAGHTPHPNHHKFAQRISLSDENSTPRGEKSFQRQSLSANGAIENRTTQQLAKRLSSTTASFSAGLLRVPLKAIVNEERPSVVGLFARFDTVDENARVENVSSEKDIMPIETTTAIITEDKSGEVLTNELEPFLPSVSTIEAETIKTIDDAAVKVEIVAASEDSSDSSDCSVVQAPATTNNNEVVCEEETKVIEEQQQQQETITSITSTETIVKEVKEEYDVTLLLLANDTLIQHLAESETRRLIECGRLRQERDELRVELKMQENRFKLHAQRLEDSMQQGLMTSLERIRDLTNELEEAKETINKLQKRCKQKKDK